MEVRYQISGGPPPCARGRQPGLSLAPGEEGATCGTTQSRLLEVTTFLNFQPAGPHTCLYRLLVEAEREVRGEVSLEVVPGRDWQQGGGRGSRLEPRGALDSITDQGTSCNLM